MLQKYNEADFKTWCLKTLLQFRQSLGKPIIERVVNDITDKGYRPGNFVRAPTATTTTTTTTTAAKSVRSLVPRHVKPPKTDYMWVKKKNVFFRLGCCLGDLLKAFKAQKCQRNDMWHIVRSVVIFGSVCFFVLMQWDGNANAKGCDLMIMWHDVTIIIFLFFHFDVRFVQSCLVWIDWRIRRTTI